MFARGRRCTCRGATAAKASWNAPEYLLFLLAAEPRAPVSLPAAANVVYESVFECTSVCCRVFCAVEPYDVLEGGAVTRRIDSRLWTSPGDGLSECRSSQGAFMTRPPHYDPSQLPPAGAARKPGEYT